MYNPAVTMEYKCSAETEYSSTPTQKTVQVVIRQGSRQETRV